MKLRAKSIRRWALVILGITVLMLIGLRLHVRSRMNRTLANLRSSGAPTTWEEYIQKYSASPEALQAGRILTNLEWSIQRPSDDARENIPVIGSADIPKPGQSMTAEMRNATGSYLNGVSNKLSEIYQALQANEVRYPVSAKNAVLLDPQVGLAREAVSLLSTECIYAVDQTNLDRATKAVAAQLKISDTLYWEPGWIGQLTRFSMISVAIGNVERIIGLSHLDSRHVRLLQDTIRPMLSHVSLAHTIAGERVGFLGYALPGGDFVPLDLDDNFSPDQWDTLWARIRVQIYRMVGLADQDITWYLETGSQIEARMAGSLIDQKKLWTHWSEFLPRDQNMPAHFWSEQARRPTETFIGKHIVMHAKLRAAWTALAVVQFRLDHDGDLPASLNKLVPKYLESVPIEPLSNRPFEMTKKQNGFSIGTEKQLFDAQFRQ